jgi:hypothetical protein
MGAWSPLRYAPRPRGAAAGFSPGAMGAFRPDGLASSVEKKKYMLSQKNIYVLAKTGMVHVLDAWLVQW